MVGKWVAKELHWGNGSIWMWFRSDFHRQILLSVAVMLLGVVLFSKHVQHRFKGPSLIDTSWRSAVAFVRCMFQWIHWVEKGLYLADAGWRSRKVGGWCECNKNSSYLDGNPRSWESVV